MITAAAYGHVEVVRLLVRAGADTTLGDADGPPIDNICKAPSADKANKAEIRAILLSATELPQMHSEAASKEESPAPIYGVDAQHTTSEASR